MTEFVQKLNYQRALQGELVRTINQFSEVVNSRVHLVLPEKSLFLRDKKQAKASVVVKLLPGRRLTPSQVQGIVHLVSGSVQGLEPENVTVMDSHGRILAGPTQGSKFHTLTSSQQEFQSQMERDLEERIQTMLERVVGEGKVIVRASLDLDFKEIEKTEEIYDPSKVVVRSEQRTDEKSEGTENVAMGVAGVSSNASSKKAVSNLKPEKRYRKTNEVINYEISKIIKRTIEPVGKLRRISIAVLIDGIYKEVKEKNGKTTLKYFPRSEEEIKRFEEIVKKAIGYDKDRGDQVEVVNIRFKETELNPIDESIAKTIERKLLWSPLIRYMGSFVIVLLFILFIVRPLIKWLTIKSEEADLIKRLPSRLEELEAEFPKVALGEGKIDRQQLIALAKKDPEMVAKILKGWLRT